MEIIKSFLIDVKTDGLINPDAMEDKEIDVSNRLILDPCCGSKMFWFDKENPNVLFH